MRGHILHVFRKDGLELLRDRRTLFVNVLLPVLLYPLMLLFLIQVMQLTQAQRPPPPRVAVVGVDAELRGLVADPPPDPEQVVPAPGQKAAPRDGRNPVLVEPTANVAAELRTLAEAVRAPWAQLRALERRWRTEPAARAALGPELTAARERLDAARAPLLARLRAEDLDAVYVVVDVTAPEDAERGRRTLVAAKDDARSDYDEARALLGRAFTTYERQLQERTLEAAGLDLAVLDPLRTEPVDLAPRAQTTRARLAGIVPLLLVLMAVSGAFYPALDLLAGERERGTLETLLTWPARRRDIFVGKLLVTIVAATLSVVLNIASIGLTTGIAGSQLAAAAGAADAGGLFSVGLSVLALSFITLLPLVVTLAAVSLALAGIAASAKEAQNYLTPLFLVVVAAAGVAMVPDARPNAALDLIPITGPVLALKESLRATSVPWGHLALATAASVALAAVVVSWSVRLLDSERFCYPGLVRAGWGRFRKWGPRPLAPGALEVVGVYAVCVAGFLAIGGWLQGAPPLVMVMAPLVVCVLLPPLVHRWLGDYPAATTLGLARADRGSLIRATLAIPLAIAASIAIGNLQPKLGLGGGDEIERIFAAIRAQGGLPLLLLAMAVTPAVCEEVLCRGTLLSGLRHSLGRRGGVIVSSFLFAVLHLSPERFLPQFVVGLALGTLALRAGSIWPAVLLHFGHNAGLVLLDAWLRPDLPLPAEAAPPPDPAAQALFAALLALALAGLWFCLGGTRRWSGPVAREPASDR